MEPRKPIRRPAAASRVGSARRSAASAERDGEPVLYRLHVELLDISPTIWRRILVPDWISLAKLHLVLQAAMGWTNSHLHQFEIAGIKYGVPDDEWPELVVVDDRRVTLANVVGAKVTDFRYEYDFGDGWEHAIHMEAIEPIANHARYPLCLAGANACPPEDVGGPGAYAEFLEAIRNPRHAEHDDYLRWCGGAFDPAGFDLNSVNSALRRIAIPSRR
jgi:pRiA4b ORF-3-like protein